MLFERDTEDCKLMDFFKLTVIRVQCIDYTSCDMYINILYFNYCMPAHYISLSIESTIIIITIEYLLLCLKNKHQIHKLHNDFHNF